MDSFTLKAIAGHDSVVTSERYVHTSSAAIKAAFVGYSRHTAGTRFQKSP